jgi:PAS domain S-box-containing protein
MISILVVEDESIVAEDIQNSLQRMGYTVCGVASSGKEALQLAKDLNPDLVLMDIVLKGGIDGIETAETIRTQNDIPVVYLTAHADKKTLERAKITEPYGYLMKPIEDTELHTTIEMAVYKHKTEKKVQETEQWLSTVLNSIGDGVIATDIQGTITFMNPVAEQLTGYTHTEAVGTPLHKVLCIDDLVKKVIQAGELRIPHAILTNKDNEDILLNIDAVLLKDGGGIVVAFRDITKLKNAENALQESRVQLRSLFEASKRIASTMNLEKIYTFTADSVQLLAGFDHFMIFIGLKEEKYVQCVYGSEEIKDMEGLAILYGKGIVGTCAERGELLVAHNVSHEEGTLRNQLNMKSVIAIPLAMGHSLQGVLCSVKCTEEYTQADADILQLLNEVVSSAIKNALLHKKLKQSRQNLEKNIQESAKKAEIILKTKQSLQNEGDWEKGLKNIVKSVGDLGFELAGIFLVDPMKIALEYYCGKGDGLPQKGSLISLKNTEYTGVECVLKKETIPSGESPVIPAESVIWVPIVVQNEAFAVIVAGANEQVTPEDVNHLEMLAGMCAAFIDRTRFLVKPMAETLLKTECTHWLEPMDAYIIREKKPEKTLEIFTDLVTHGIPGFIISREHPERLRQRCNLVNTPVLWLSRTKGKNTINPDDLPKLHYIIEDFTRKCHESVVLLDGLEYLITQNDFASVLNYLQDLKDVVVLHNARLVIPLHVEALPADQLSLLEREFTCMGPE